MEWEEKSFKRSVREGYTVLLRAEAHLLLPKDREEICRFYEQCAESCMAWAEEIYGAWVRADFLNRSEVREKSQFRTHRYRFDMRIPWEAFPYVAILCESERGIVSGQMDFFRICKVWNVEEESILPPRQAMHAFEIKFAKNELPFRPDGFYREGDKLVVFQNPTSHNKFLEAKLPIKMN